MKVCSSETGRRWSTDKIGDTLLLHLGLVAFLVQEGPAKIQNFSKSLSTPFLVSVRPKISFYALNSGTNVYLGDAKGGSVQ